MKMLSIKNVFIKKAATWIVVLSLIFMPFSSLNAAGPLTALSDTMSNMNDSAVSNHTIQFTSPTGVASGQTIILTFPTGFDVNAGDNLLDYTDVDVTDDTVDVALAGSPSGATWGVGVTSSAITLTNGTTAVAGGSVIAIEIGTNATSQVAGDKQIVNQTVAQNNTDPKIVITGSFTDTGTIAVEIITDDQVSMSATVDPAITFSLSANSSDFGVITTSAPKSASPNITLTTTTNANTGFTLTVRDEGSGTNPGLYNSIGSYLVASSTATLAASTEGYGIQGATNGNGSGGTITIAATYDKTSNDVGGLQRTAQTLATAGSPVNLREVVVTHKASVSGLTKAGSYNDTLTYICTGNF